MDILKPCAVIGTNAWGSAAYEVMVRGSYVENDVIKSAMETAEKLLQYHDCVLLFMSSKDIYFLEDKYKELRNNEK